MQVQVRNSESNKTYGSVWIEPGETVTVRFNMPIHTGNSYLESNIEGVNLTIVKALGVRFDELPSNGTYRRHRYEHDSTPKKHDIASK